MDIFVNAYIMPQDSHPNENLDSLKALEKDSVDCKQKTATETLLITDLPSDILQKIFRHLSFDTISKLRMVCKYFNEICPILLNFEFNKLREMMQQKFQAIKALMPRRESARRKHPLAEESDIVETLHMRLSLLHMIFGQHIEKKFCCFFPGEIIDEIYRILRYIRSTPNLNHAYKVTDELFDLSTMAMEYFKDHIEPSLPEVSYVTHDLLEHSSYICKNISLKQTPASDMIYERAQLIQLERVNLSNYPPKNKALTKIKKQLKNSRKIGKRNRHGIIKVQKYLKRTEKKVKALNEGLQEIKCQYENFKKARSPDYYNLNRILLDIRQKQEFLTGLSNCSDKKASTSELFPGKGYTLSGQSSCERSHKEEVEKICSFLRKASTTLTIIPIKGSDEIIDCSLEVPEKGQLHTISNANYGITGERLTDQQTKCDSG